jgi:hypothetical protein
MAQYRLQDRCRGIIGPVGLQTVLDLRAAGVVDSQAQVSCDGGSFLPLSQFPELAAPSPQASANPARRGALGPRTMMGLLHEVYGQRQTGRILVESTHGLRKDVYLRDGSIVFLSSNIPSERLGNFLVTRGKITQEELLVALDAMKVDNNRLGETLIRLGLIEARDLGDELREHQLERLIELCCWREGSFAFYAGHAYQGTDLDMQLVIPELLMRAVREMPEEMLRSYLHDEMPRVPSWTAARKHHLPLTSQEEQAAAAIPRGGVLGALVEGAADDGARRTLLAVVQVLAAVGALEFLAAGQD